MATRDKDTGLPLLGTAKEVPISVDLVAEHKGLIEQRDIAKQAAGDAALQALGVLVQAEDLVRPALEAQRAVLEMEHRLFALNGLKKSDVDHIDLQRGVIVLK